jgi:hypothetical protein
MPVKIEGLVSAGQMFIRLDTTAKRRVMNVLIRRAYRIRDTARKMAPEEHGNLEAAIKVRGDGGRERDAFGRFQRSEVEVYIDTDMEVPERPGHTVGDYAYEIHEHLEPAGLMQLGDRSRLKQETVDVQVGGAFMDRAVEAEIDATIDAELVDILRDFM